MLGIEQSTVRLDKSCLDRLWSTRSEAVGVTPIREMRMDCQKDCKAGWER